MVSGFAVGAAAWGAYEGPGAGTSGGGAGAGGKGACASGAPGLFTGLPQDGQKFDAALSGAPHLLQNRGTPIAFPSLYSNVS